MKMRDRWSCSPWCRDSAPNSRHKSLGVSLRHSAVRPTPAEADQSLKNSNSTQPQPAKAKLQPAEAKGVTHPPFPSPPRGEASVNLSTLVEMRSWLARVGGAGGPLRAMSDLPELSWVGDEGTWEKRDFGRRGNGWSLFCDTVPTTSGLPVWVGSGTMPALFPCRLESAVGPSHFSVVSLSPTDNTATLQRRWQLKTSPS
jgi:hypothetical protein